MVLEIKKQTGPLKMKQIWFADYPYDVKNIGRVIFRDCKNKVEMPGFSCEEHLTFVIDLTQDLEKIWNNMSKSSCRYEINRAEREGIKVAVDRKFEDFVKINKLFVKAKNLQKSSIMVKFIKKYATLFIAESEDDILGGQLYLTDENNMRLLLAPSKRLSVDKEKSALVGMGNRLMIWEAIKYAKAKGMKEFDLGGYYAGGMDGKILDTPNLFKQSFGGNKICRYIYQKEYSPIYKSILVLKKYLRYVKRIISSVRKMIPFMKILKDIYCKVPGKGMPRRYMYLFKAIKENKARKIMEIGTFNGVHAIEMIEEAKKNSPLQEINYYGFDLFELLDKETNIKEIAKIPPSLKEIEQKLKKTGANIHLYQGYTKDTLPKVINELPDMDFIYIDGGHSIETIENDWKYVQKVTGLKTTVIFDDYWNRDDTGCKKIVEDIDKNKFDVEILPIQDKFKKDWGLLKINFAKVVKKK